MVSSAPTADRTGCSRQESTAPVGWSEGDVGDDAAAADEAADGMRPAATAASRASAD